MDLSLLPLFFSLILTVASRLLHLSLPRWFPLFVLASSVCRSLQCLISALTQGGGGEHSHAVWREGRCKQITLVCVRSVLATLGLPLLMACVLSQSVLLRL